MIDNELSKKADEARRDGYTVLSVAEGPVELSTLIKFAESLFPNHTLDQLAITQAEEDQLS